LLQKFYPFLDQLITVNYDAYKDKSNKLFDEEVVAVDPDDLGDHFLKKDFRIDSLKVYFTEDGWASVLNVFQVKQKRSTCSVCDKYCLNNCVQCSTCFQWFHYKCVGLTVGIRDSFVFKCTTCK